VIEIVRTGMQATIQDLGRSGYGHLGVPAAGAMDPLSLRTANHLVGNGDCAAGIEFLMGRFIVRFVGQHAFCVSGAPVDPRLDGRPVAADAWHLGRPGQILEATRPDFGMRTYLAVAGGIEVPPILGSRSTDTLSGLGPDPLRPGDVLDIGRALRTAPFVDAPSLSAASPNRLVSVSYRWGPREDRFTPAAREALRTSSWQITHRTDRIGVRLQGPTLSYQIQAELPTEGLALGSIQVPPSGQPIIHLANHPPTGGYPVIGVIAGPDVARVAQCTPGTRLRLHPLSDTWGLT
jgi:biotin-dependent carboxylase-like uncharacterized protein